MRHAMSRRAVTLFYRALENLYVQNIGTEGPQREQCSLLKSQLAIEIVRKCVREASFVALPLTEFLILNTFTFTSLEHTSSFD